MDTLMNVLDWLVWIPLLLGAYVVVRRRLHWALLAFFLAMAVAKIPWVGVLVRIVGVGRHTIWGLSSHVVVSSLTMVILLAVRVLSPLLVIYGLRRTLDRPS